MVENPCEDQVALEELIQQALLDIVNDTRDEANIGEVTAFSTLSQCKNQLLFEYVHRLCDSNLIIERILGVNLLRSYNHFSDPDKTDEYFVMGRLEEESRKLLLKIRLMGKKGVKRLIGQ